jgi:hypothetical protein
MAFSTVAVSVAHVLRATDWEAYRQTNRCRETGVVRSDATRLRHEWECDGGERIWR